MSFESSSERPERSDRSERGGRGAGGGSFGGFRSRPKSCPFTGKNAPKIDYKDVNLLRRYVSERGKIMPNRITAVSAKMQRRLTQAIKRARFLALLPYADKRSGN
jgi:small subunit ribosomal protein S18